MHPNLVSQAQEIEIFCEDCKLAASLGLFQGLWASFFVLKYVDKKKKC